MPAICELNQLRYEASDEKLSYLLDLALDLKLQHVAA